MDKGSMFIIQVYADDIILGSDDDRLSKQFSKDMQSEFDMCLLGELKFFLGLHIFGKLLTQSIIITFEDDVININFNDDYASFVHLYV